MELEIVCDTEKHLKEKFPFFNIDINIYGYNINEGIFICVDMIDNPENFEEFYEEFDRIFLTEFLCLPYPSCMKKEGVCPFKNIAEKIKQIIFEDGRNKN